MNICDKSFCGNGHFMQDVIDILNDPNDGIFVNCGKQLEARYYVMNSNAASCNVGTEFEKGYALASPAPALTLNPKFVWLSQTENLGHDLPVWIAPEAGPNTLVPYNQNAQPSLTTFFAFPKLKDKRVMFVGLDPMRNGKPAGSIYLSAPWGMHSPDYRSGHRITVTNPNGTKKVLSGVQAKFIAYIIETMTKNGASVYITDAAKLYAKPGYDNSMDATWYQNILNKEINLFEPDYVITIGNLAAKGIVINHPAPFPFPHPNGLRMSTAQKIMRYTYLMKKI